MVSIKYLLEKRRGGKRAFLFILFASSNFGNLHPYRQLDQEEEAEVVAEEVVARVEEDHQALAARREEELLEEELLEREAEVGEVPLDRELEGRMAAVRARSPTYL